MVFFFLFHYFPVEEGKVESSCAVRLAYMYHKVEVIIGDTGNVLCEIPFVRCCLEAMK